MCCTADSKAYWAVARARLEVLEPKTWKDQLDHARQLVLWSRAYRDVALHMNALGASRAVVDLLLGRANQIEAKIRGMA